MENKSIFDTLNAINVNGHTEKKNGLTYLSWAWAWAEVKKKYPLATYTIYENAEGLNYHHDHKTAWVKTGVTIDGLEHIEYLPVMDYKNKSIPLEQLTSFDVNKTIQRSLTKAAARHGLGLYIYAGEDLPEDDSGAKPAASNKVSGIIYDDDGTLATKDQLDTLRILGVDLNKVAEYFKKDISEVTYKEAQSILNYKTKK